MYRITRRRAARISRIGNKTLAWGLYLIIPLFLLFLFVDLKWRGFKINLLSGGVFTKVGVNVKKAVVLPWLSVSGRSMVDESGKKVILRGVNIGAINWGFDEWLPKAVYQAAHEWKANVVRVRIYQSDFHAGEAAFFDKLEREILKPARNAGVYVILNPDTEGKNMWRAVARRYRGDSTVLYDILAEPHDTSGQDIISVYKELIPIVREENPRALIFVTGGQWGRYINQYANDPLPYENLVYRTNIYNEESEFAGLFGEVSKVYPVFIGEFGADGYPPMTREAVSSLLQLTRELEIGWTAWHFHSDGCPCLLSDYEIFAPSPYGEIVLTDLKRID
jgi:endoglucanase